MIVKRLIASLAMTASVFSYAHAQESKKVEFKKELARVSKALNRHIELVGTAINADQWDNRYHAMAGFVAEPGDSEVSNQALCAHLKTLSGFQLESMYEMIEGDSQSLSSCRGQLLAKVKFYQKLSKSSNDLAEQNIRPIPFTVRDVPSRDYLSGQGLFKNEVMLTFDDGPSTVTTRKIIEYLNKAGVKAAFFNTGQNARKEINGVPNGGLVNEILKNGHILGSHSYWHTINMSEKYQYCSDFNYDFFLGEFIGGHMTIAENNKYGYIDPFFRFPNGSHNADFDKNVKELGLKMFGWNVDSFDYMLGPRSVTADNPEGMPRWMVDARTGQKIWRAAYDNEQKKFLKTGPPMTHQERRYQILKNVVDAINANSERKGVILMHDIAGQSIEALPLVLNYLADNGFTVVLQRPVGRIVDNKDPGFESYLKNAEVPVIDQGARYLQETGHTVQEMIPLRPKVGDKPERYIVNFDFYSMFKLTPPAMQRSFDAARCARQKTL